MGAVLYNLCNPTSTNTDEETGGPCYREESFRDKRRHIHADLATEPPGKLLPDNLERRKIPGKRETRAHKPEEDKHVYSEALRNLIAQCLEYYPAQRPTIEALGDEIRRNRDIFDDEDKISTIPLIHLYMRMLIDATHGRSHSSHSPAQTVC